MGRAVGVCRTWFQYPREHHIFSYILPHLLEGRSVWWQSTLGDQHKKNVKESLGYNLWSENKKASD